MTTKSYKLLREKISPERLVRNEVRVQTTLIHMALQELRQSLSLTQQDLATKLELSQSALSKLEHQEDIQVSTLAGYIEALGGQLKLVASFPEQEVIIGQFEKRK
jgi:transcriptional regulator with XRE-family HTH domain